MFHLWDGLSPQELTSKALAKRKSLAYDGNAHAGPEGHRMQHANAADKHAEAA